jgi:hypothetical protein
MAAPQLADSSLACVGYGARHDVGSIETFGPPPRKDPIEVFWCPYVKGFPREAEDWGRGDDIKRSEPRPAAMAVGRS